MVGIFVLRQWFLSDVWDAFKFRCNKTASYPAALICAIQFLNWVRRFSRIGTDSKYSSALQKAFFQVRSKLNSTLFLSMSVRGLAIY